MNYKEMNSKFYVSLEAARLLKEKGYNEPTEYLHSDDIIHKGICLNYLNPELCVGIIVEDNISYPCPTKAEAIDWLESKGVVVQTIPLTPNVWKWRMFSTKYNPYVDYIEESEMLYKTRLEAEDDVIINALTLL